MKKFLNIIIFVNLIFSFSCGFTSRTASTDPAVKETISSNPYDLIPFNSSTGVLVRYGSPYFWLVDTNAGDNASFMIEKFDLSPYDTVDGIPEMMGGIAVSYTHPYDGVADYIIVALQRLTENEDTSIWDLDKDAYLVVLKPDGSEYNTALGDATLKGIKLRVRNPYRRIFYDKYHNYIYVPGAGSLITNDGTGGIDKVKLNPDGTFKLDTNYPFYKGHSVTDLVVFSNEIGVFVEYMEWGNSCLKSFNASTASLITTTSCILDIGGMGVNVYALETWKDPADSKEYLFLALSISSSANKDIDGDGTNENGGYIVILDSSFTLVKLIKMPSSMNPSDITPQYALDGNGNYLRVAIALTSSDWSSGGIGLINCDNGISTCHLDPNTLINPTISDLVVSSYNKDFYLIERYQKDSISKYNIDETDFGDFTPIWQYSTNE